MAIDPFDKLFGPPIRKWRNFSKLRILWPGMFMLIRGSVSDLRSKYSQGDLSIAKGCTPEIPGKACGGSLRLYATWGLCVIIVFKSVDY